MEQNARRVDKLTIGLEFVALGESHEVIHGKEKL